MAAVCGPLRLELASALDYVHCEEAQAKRAAAYMAILNQPEVTPSSRLVTPPFARLRPRPDALPSGEPSRRGTRHLHALGTALFLASPLGEGRVPPSPAFHTALTSPCRAHACR